MVLATLQKEIKTDCFVRDDFYADNVKDLAVAVIEQALRDYKEVLIDSYVYAKPDGSYKYKTAHGKTSKEQIINFFNSDNIYYELSGINKKYCLDIIKAIDKEFKTDKFLTSIFPTKKEDINKKNKGDGDY